MTVTSKAGDTAGAVLDTAYTALKANVTAAPAASPQLYGAQAAQANAERDLLFHQLSTGRLTAHTILAASVFGPLGTAALSIPASDITSTNLQTVVNAISTAASPQQSFNLQLKDQLEKEFLSHLMGHGYTTPAFILNSSL